MPEIKCYMSRAEYDAICDYARADERSMSEMLRKAMREKVGRDKKKSSDGKIITWPDKDA